MTWSMKRSVKQTLRSDQRPLTVALMALRSVTCAGEGDDDADDDSEDDEDADAEDDETHAPSVGISGSQRRMSSATHGTGFRWSDQRPSGRTAKSPVAESTTS